MKLDNDGAHRLIFEIVNRACDDYVMFKKSKIRGYKCHIIDGHPRNIEKELDKISEFFASEWYSQLMPNIDPHKLMERLEFEVMTAKNKIENDKEEKEREFTDVYE